MKQKDARILWNETENAQGRYEISEIIVAECTKENGYEKRFNRHYRASWGNCNIDWMEKKAIDIIGYFFLKNFKSRDLKIQFLDDLTKIEEFREDMKNWIADMPETNPLAKIP